MTIRITCLKHELLELHETNQSPKEVFVIGIWPSITVLLSPGGEGKGEGELGFGHWYF